MQGRKPRKDPFVLMVSFAVGDEDFGVDILSVQEIHRMPVLTRLPNAPEYVDGVMSLHGKIIPVVNLRRRFGLPRKQWDANTRIIVVETSEKQIGFTVEKLQEIVRIPVSVMKPPAVFRGDMKADYISATAKPDGHRLNLLDLAKILRHEVELFDHLG